MLTLNATQSITKPNLLLPARISVWLCALFLPISLAIANVFFVCASVFCVLRLQDQTSMRDLLDHKVAWTYLAYFALLAIGLCYSSAPFAEAFPMFMKYNKLLLAVPLFALPYDERWFSATIGAFVASMTLTMLLGYLKLLGIIQFAPEMGTVEAFSRHITTNWFMSIASFFVLSYVLGDLPKRFAWLALFAGMLYYILFCSEGRTGYVVIFFLLTYALWRYANWRGVLFVLILSPALVMAAYFGSPRFHERINDVIVTTAAYHAGDETATSMSMRIRFWENSWKIIKEHPWIGTGTGSLLHETKKIEPNPAFQTRNPHNEFFNQWVQLGSFGFICWLLFLSWQWICAKDYTPNRLVVIRGMLIALISGAMMNSLLMDSLEGHLFVFMIAIAMATSKRETAC